MPAIGMGTTQVGTAASAVPLIVSLISFVILSAAKDLPSACACKLQVLRCAQDDYS